LAYKSKQTGHRRSIGIETFFLSFLELSKSGEAGLEELPFGALFGSAAVLRETVADPEEDANLEITTAVSS
jgi:hypothetical protein